jgi:hypothetical protein
MVLIHPVKRSGGALVLFQLQATGGVSAQRWSHVVDSTFPTHVPALSSLGEGAYSTVEERLRLRVILLAWPSEAPECTVVGTVSGPPPRNRERIPCGGRQRVRASTP